MIEISWIALLNPNGLNWSHVRTSWSKISTSAGSSRSPLSFSNRRSLHWPVRPVCDSTTWACFDFINSLWFGEWISSCVVRGNWTPESPNQRAGFPLERIRQARLSHARVQPSPFTTFFVFFVFFVATFIIVNIWCGYISSCVASVDGCER